MGQIRAIVLRAAGINCDVETEYALELAGAEAERVHINRVIEDKGLLDKYQIMVIPGGFSYGDDVAAGKILANQIIHHLSEPIRKFIDDGKLVLGICNGFQVLVKAGILPGDGSTGGPGDVTITYNDSGKFEDRWVYLAPQTQRCVFIEAGRRIYLPVAHAEGKVVTKDEATLERLKAEGHIAFKYVDKDGREGGYPVNPNGSMGSVAGLTDATGRVLGLMPHPERYVRRTQHPHWTRLKDNADSDGMTIFNNAVRYIKENFSLQERPECAQSAM
ncbi:MAG TPA: phosphoribosylformylglycinamidine synthase I [Sedimentisphaerales bacterium]|nr:phosphoribosylformylglycinamidine synthase I [Sedimentisphaerales bacterium]